MPARLVVFRFDRNARACRSRIALIRRQNPGIAVHGLYGGDRPLASAPLRSSVRRLLGLDSLWVSPEPGRWNWQHGDLALLRWFDAVGRRLQFDVINLLEWDLALFASLDTLYGHVPDSAVALTALTPLEAVAHEWEWVQGERAEEWQRLVAHVRAVHGSADERLACVFIGPQFPRAFLEAYATADPPSLGNDEQRVPLYAAALGFPLVDTNFRRRFPLRSQRASDEGRDRFVRFVDPVDPADVDAELAKPDGHRVFHPLHLPYDVRRTGRRPR